MNFEDLKSQDDLDNAIKSAIGEALEKETAGLKSKVEELLNEKKTEAQKRKEAEEAAKNKDLEAAKAAGKIEEVEKALSDKYGKEIEKLTAELGERNAEILTGKRDTVIESLAGKFTSPETARLMLANMVETVRGDNGIVTNFKGLDGTVVTTESDKFSEYLSSQDSFKPLLKGVDSSGGGAAGSKDKSGGAGDSVKERLQSRLAEKGLIK
jgi:antitoxin component HigA of HigAB toxin-antitoxin module